jgi:FtsP/CotA-like multicopper oxidase with cupredoxin domain
MIFDQGDEVFLSLTNVGMLVRPDLFDPHTVHFHGFPNAAQVFDGVPDSSVAINQSFTLTYYYNIQEPGTFMYHCHVEATEHMQMGMLGNLYVRPMQDGESKTDPTNDTEYTRFVYNDNDGTTGYDVEYPIQIGSFDGAFHDASHDVQPLPFAEMSDDYHLLNGRGYPDTASTANVDPASEKVGWYEDAKGWNELVDGPVPSSQQVHSLIEATPGQRILLRISNLNVTQFYTLATTGLPMKVVGTGAHILRGPGGTDLYYETNSVTLGGGEAVDVLIDTTGLEPGSKYLLYSTNTNELSNATQDFGGMMTEIHIN